MVELFYLVAFYLLALIGTLTIVVVIVAMYICSKYEVKILIGKFGKQGTKDAK